MKVSCNEVEIVIEYKNGDQQRYSKTSVCAVGKG